MDGKHYIVRGQGFGAFFGQIKGREGSEVEMANARRLWYWSGAASLSELAVSGVKNPQNCKFAVAVDSIVLLGAVEIIPCTEKAVESVNGVPAWTA